MSLEVSQLRVRRGADLALDGVSFALEPGTERWIQQHHTAIAGVAGERVLAELEKLAAAPAGDKTEKRSERRPRKESRE